MLQFPSREGSDPLSAHEQPPEPVTPTGGPGWGHFSPRDMGSVSEASKTSFGTFGLPAISASRLSKPRASQLDEVKHCPEQGRALLATKLSRHYWTAPSLLRDRKLVFTLEAK